MLPPGRAADVPDSAFLEFVLPTNELTDDVAVCCLTTVHCLPSLVSSLLRG